MAVNHNRKEKKRTLSNPSGIWTVEMRLMESSVQIRIYLFTLMGAGGGSFICLFAYFICLLSCIYLHISSLVNILFKSFVHFYQFILFITAF